MKNENRKLKTVFIGLWLFALAGCSTPRPESENSKASLDSVTVALDFRIRAGQYYEADQLDSALALYSKATQYNRNDKHAWHGVATTLGRLGRHDEAGPAYDEALRIDSTYVYAIWHRACGYAKNLQKEQALADLRRAIELDSTIKSDARRDACFDWMWEDKEFLSIVQ